MFADLTKGFPPTVLITGTREMFLSNTVLSHRALRAADITAELHVLEAGGHGGCFGLAPEDKAVQRDVKLFADRYWGVKPDDPGAALGGFRRDRPQFRGAR